MKSRLYQILSEHLSERKQSLFDQVVSYRTRHIALVLEDLYQAQNISAIQRSAESWGIQDMYIIENAHSFSHHRRVAKGANCWIDMHRFNETSDNTSACFDVLRKKGFQIVVTTLDEKATSLYSLDLSKKTAFVMGSELNGASPSALMLADKLIKIPTYGFTESLNVSVAAAIIIQNFTERIRKENIAWQLTEEEKLDLKIQWARQSIYWSKYLVEMYENGELRMEN